MTYKIRKSKFRRMAQIMIFAAVIGISQIGNCFADSASMSKITKERLDKLYNESITMQLAGEDDAIAFVKKHLHEDYEGVVHLDLKVEGGPAKKSTNVITKYEYVRDMKENYETSTIEDLESGIVSYEIISDGKSAKVKDHTYAVSNIIFEAEKRKKVFFKLRQFITCDNLYVLSDKNVVLLKSGTCEIEGQLSKGKSL